MNEISKIHPLIDRCLDYLSSHTLLHVMNGRLMFKIRPSPRPLTLPQQTTQQQTTQQHTTQQQTTQQHTTQQQTTQQHNNKQHNNKQHNNKQHNNKRLIKDTN